MFQNTVMQGGLSRAGRGEPQISDREPGLELRAVGPAKSWHKGEGMLTVWCKTGWLGTLCE